MIQVLFRMLLVFVLAGVWFVSGVFAQQASSAGKTTRLALGTVSISPEGEVSMPVYLTLAPSVQVSRITVQVNFPTRELSWVRVEPGLQRELKAKAEVRADAKDPSKSVVRLEIAAEGSPKGIENGMVAMLRIRVNKNTHPGGVPVAIDNVSARGLGPAGKPVTDIAGFGARIEVVPPGANPYIGCFFFTH